jgi:hypothetical protein
VTDRAESAIVATSGGASGAGRKRRLSYRAALSVVSAAYLFLMMPFLGMRISTHHGWRQSQTADTTRLLARTGFDVFHPRLSVFGPRATLAYEFPWYQTIAGLLTKLGVPLIVALRGTSMAFTLLTALGVAGLTRRLAGERAAIWAAVLMLFNPMTFAWGRAPLIESFTTALAVAWVLGAWRIRTHLASAAPINLLTWLKLASLPMALGIVTATSKFTTALPWSVVVLAVLFQPRLRTAFISAVAVGIPLGCGVLWTVWADHLKKQSVLSQMESSSATRRHLFRPLAERANVDVWGVIGARSLMFVGVVGLIWLAIGATFMLAGRQRLVSAAVLSVPLTAPMIFFGLYQVHDYYQMAIIPALAVALGIGAQHLHQKLNRNPIAVVGLLSAHMLGFLLVGGQSLLQTQTSAGYAPRTELAATTSASEQVLGIGQAWNPQPFFEADRQGYLMGLGPEPDALVELLDSDLGGARALWTARPEAPLAAKFLGHFPLVASVGESTYRFGLTQLDLESGPVEPIVWWELGAQGASERSTDFVCDGVRRPLPRSTNRVTLQVDRQIWLDVGPGAALPIASGTVRSVTTIEEASCMATDGTQTVATIF